MPCPRHGLTLALVCKCGCMSQTCLTLARSLADACPGHVLHWLSHNPMLWHEHLICSLGFSLDLSTFSIINMHTQFKI
ncbi:hypothetical protein V6Z11_A09G105600 [Gossypium hirsutum]